MTTFFVDTDVYYYLKDFDIIEEVEEKVIMKPHCDCGQLDCNRATNQPVVLKTAFKVQTPNNHSRNALKKLFGHSVRGVRII